MPTPRLQAFAVADATGTAVFKFAQCPQGSVVTGIVAVPNAPAAANSTPNLGGVDYPPFLGANPYGPVQAVGGEALKITTTGLASGTQYSAVWVVNEEMAGDHQNGLIIPYGSSTVNAQGIKGGIPLVVDQNVDRLSNGTGVIPVSTGASATRSFTALNDYSGFAVSISNTQISPPGVSCSISNGSGLPNFSGTQSGFYNGGQLWFFFPMPAIAGDTITLSFRSLGAAQLIIAGEGPQIQVYGLSTFAQPAPLRGDGRLPPVGNNFVGFTTAVSGLQNVIAAPGTNSSLFIASLTAQPPITAAAASIAAINGTLGGGSFSFTVLQWGVTANPSPVPNMVPPGGILLDPATALTINPGQNATAGFWEVFVSYDVVV